MTPAKRALLIGSPYGGLQGTSNDVEMMSGVLESRGFSVMQCYKESATRDGILSAWEQLTSESSEDDIVVIYYSGHGGLADSEPRTIDEQPTWPEKPWRFQFIVPWDYDQTTEEDFRGISDIEISHMLQGTTKRTQNVTIILDCCHSARLARDPRYPNNACPKGLPDIQHHDILNLKFFYKAS
jgi:hypothetical protein